MSLLASKTSADEHLTKPDSRGGGGARKVLDLQSPNLNKSTLIQTKWAACLLEAPLAKKKKS